MDPMVSARIPAELRDQVNEGLKSIGSSPTELIKSAYEFFLKTNTLPNERPRPKAGRRKLKPEQASMLEQSIKMTTRPVPESFFEGLSYDQMLEDELRESYEALS